QAWEPYGGGGQGNPLSTFHQGLRSREDIFQNLTRQTVEQMAQDAPLKQLIGMQGAHGQGLAGNPLAGAEQIRHNYLGGSPADDAMRNALNQKVMSGTATQAEAAQAAALNAGYEQSTRLADWIKGLDVRYAKEQLPYWNAPLADMAARLVSSERAISGAG